MKSETTPLTPYEELIQNLENRTLRQSYSKIKNLDSPINYINAILKPKVQNEGMSLGSIVDCLLLTEEDFDKQFTVLDAVPTTDKQMAFCNAVSALVDIQVHSHEEMDQIWEEVKKNGFSRVQTDHLKEYVLATLMDKKCISEEDFAKAKNIVDNLRDSDEIMDELAEMEHFQYKLEFKYKGWNFVSYLDAANSRGFTDLKFSSNFHPDKYSRYTLEDYGYDIQLGLYSIGFEIVTGNIAPRVTHLVYDAVGNHALLEFDSGYIEWCRRKVDFYLACLDKMIREKAYKKSYNFFRQNRTIYKPKWAPGFDMSFFQSDDTDSITPQNSLL